MRRTNRKYQDNKLSNRTKPSPQGPTGHPYRNHQGNGGKTYFTKQVIDAKGSYQRYTRLSKTFFHTIMHQTIPKQDHVKTTFTTRKTRPYGQHLPYDRLQSRHRRHPCPHPTTRTRFFLQTSTKSRPTGLPTLLYSQNKYRTLRYTFLPSQYPIPGVPSNATPTTKAHRPGSVRLFRNATTLNNEAPRQLPTKTNTPLPKGHPPATPTRNKTTRPIHKNRQKQHRHQRSTNNNANTKMYWRSSFKGASTNQYNNYVRFFTRLPRPTIQRVQQRQLYKMRRQSPRHYNGESTKAKQFRDVQSH